MNQKGLYWLLGILTAFIVAIAVFVKRSPDTVTEPADQSSTAEVADEATPLVDEDREADTDTAVTGTGATSGETAQKDEFLLAIEAKIDDIKTTLKEYKDRAPEAVTATVNQLETEVSELESKVSQARTLAMESWPETKGQIEQQYEDVVERFNQTLGGHPASESADELPSTPPAAPEALDQPQASPTAPTTP